MADSQSTNKTLGKEANGPTCMYLWKAKMHKKEKIA
jgi:hypothetical protein